MEQPEAIPKEQWATLYNKWAHAYLDLLVPGQFFAAEDMHRVLRDCGLSEPAHPNCWGTAARLLLGDWIADKRIVQEGGKNGSRRAHGQFFRTYRKL